MYISSYHTHNVINAVDNDDGNYYEINNSSSGSERDSYFDYNSSNDIRDSDGNSTTVAKIKTTTASTT